MPWKCPACETQIRHDGDSPAPNRLYRCHVCRLELTLDPHTNRMGVPPLPDALPERPTLHRPKPTNEHQ
jgi:hypothetical protein